HEREEVARGLECFRVPTSGSRGLKHPPNEKLEPRDRLYGSREVAVGLLTCQLHHRSAVRRDEDRHAMDRREHRLQRGEARLPGPRARSAHSATSETLPRAASPTPTRRASSGIWTASPHEA